MKKMTRRTNKEQTERLIKHGIDVTKATLVASGDDEEVIFNLKGSKEEIEEILSKHGGYYSFTGYELFCRLPAPEKGNTNTGKWVQEYNELKKTCKEGEDIEYLVNKLCEINK